MQIDWWTLALQAVNFLILVWLLARFFYRPVAAIVAERRTEAQKLLADAAAERTVIETLRGEIATARESLATERQKLLDSAQSDADRLRHDVLTAARAEAERLRSSADADAARTRATATRELAEMAEDLAVVIARKLLTRLGGEGAKAAFYDGLCAKVAALPAQSQALFRDGRTIEVVTASPLDPEEEDALRRALASCLGAAPKLDFKPDPALIAGVELHAGDIVLRNTWQEDLRAIREDLARHV